MTSLSQPVLVVLVDGMNAAATQHMPWLLAEVAAGRMTRHPLTVARPTWSRPNYATLITGRTPAEHGISSNGNTSRVRDTLIDDAHAASGRVALAGYHWWRDLVGPDLDHAWYYDADDTPDDEVFGAARSLMTQYRPLLTIVHPMSVDFAGHHFGGFSPEYFAAARRMDERTEAFAAAFRGLTPAGTLLVTTDHGMTARGHGKDSAAETDVWYFSTPRHHVHTWPHHQAGMRELVRTLLGAPQAAKARPPEP